MGDLTSREREILCLTTLTNLGIAVRLGIGYQTVKNRLTGIYAKLGIKGVRSTNGKRVKALLVAMERGIITLDEIEPPPVSMLMQAGWDRERFRQMCEARWREMEGAL